LRQSPITVWRGKLGQLHGCTHTSRQDGGSFLFGGLSAASHYYRNKMKITEIPFGIKATDFSEDTHTRSEGLHLGSVLDRIQDLLYPVENKWKGDMAMGIGFLWERILTWVMLKALYESGKLLRPGELHVDGIYMNPDGYAPDDHVLCEYKATWKSTSHPIDSSKYWRYWMQIKAYCYAIRATKARLYVLHVMGDWRNSGPIPLAYEAEFTTRELKDNWQMIVREAERIKEEQG